MKNKLFTIFALAFYIISVQINCQGQVIDNKINFYLSGMAGNFSGNNLAQDEGFVFPAFHSNLKDLLGGGLKINVKLHSNVSLGLSYEYLKSGNWELSGREEYTGGTATLKTFGVPIQIHSKFAATGFFNRWKCFLELTPSLGHSEINFDEILFDITENDEVIVPPTASQDQFWGIKGAIGAEYRFSNFLGMYLSYFRQFNKIDAPLYHEKEIQYGAIQLGMLFRLKRDKLFLY